MEYYNEKYVDDLLDTINNLTEELELAKKEIEEYLITIEKLEKDIETKDDRIYDLEAGIEKARDLLFDFIR